MQIKYHNTKTIGCWPKATAHLTYSYYELLFIAKNTPHYAFHSININAKRRRFHTRLIKNIYLKSHWCFKLLELFNSGKCSFLKRIGNIRAKLLRVYSHKIRIISTLSKTNNLKTRWRVTKLLNKQNVLVIIL